MNDAARQITTFKPDWFEWPEVKRMLKLLHDGGVTACFVGGCIRDALAGKVPNDIDIVVDKPVPELLSLCASANLEAKVIEAPWGVVRVAMGGLSFDLLYVYGHMSDHINTVKEGKHSFQDIIDIWARYFDFTINGLYLFPSGELHDHYGGVADLKAGRLRFLGEPDAWIAADIRRILRFFRFYAWFGKGEPDSISLHACVSNASKLLHLQRDLVQTEVEKLLMAPHALKSLTLMQQHDVIKYALGFTISNLDLIGALERVEKLYGQVSDWQVRMALLLLSAPLPPEEALAHLCKFWQANDDTRQALSTLLEYMVAVDADMSAPDRQKLAETLGTPMVNNLLVLRWALEDDVEAAKERYLAVI